MARTSILRDHAEGLPLVRPVALPVDRDAIRSEHERAVEQGRSAGYAEGLAEARELARADAERVGARLDSALAALAAAADGTTSALSVEFERLDAGAVDLAFAIAEAVIGRELAVSVSPGADAVRRALVDSAFGDGVTVRMHPQDATEIAGSPLLGGVTTVLADPAIDRGGCVVECGPVLVDARIETALARVRQVLDEATGRT